MAIMHMETILRPQIYFFVLCIFPFQSIYAAQLDQLTASSNDPLPNEGDQQIHRERISQGQQSAGNTVIIYKGSLPWAPLARAKAFGLRSSGNSKLDEENDMHPLAVEPAEAISENNDADGELEEGSGEGEILAQQLEIPSLPKSAPDYVDIGQENRESARNDQNIRAELHESLRQPLRRLSDRQLSLLLKQIRKQRRQQQKELQGNGGEGNGTTTAGESAGIEEQSRKEMLNELRELLRQPTDGRKLIRPKLLTNINIVPSEWSIYPPKSPSIGAEIDAANGGNERKNEGITANINNENGQQNVGGEVLKSLEILVQNGTKENETAEIGGRIGQNSSNEIKQENSQGNKTDLTTISAEEASKRTPSADELAPATTTRPRPGWVHAAEFAPIESNELLEGNALDFGDTEDEKSERQILKSEQKQQKNESEERRTDEKIAQLSAYWRVVEQKFALEMETAMRTAGEALGEKAEAENLGENANNDLGILDGKGKKNANSTVLFSAKTWEPIPTSNLTNLDGNLPARNAEKAKEELAPTELMDPTNGQALPNGTNAFSIGTILPSSHILLPGNDLSNGTKILSNDSDDQNLSTNDTIALSNDQQNDTFANIPSNASITPSNTPNATNFSPNQPSSPSLPPNSLRTLADLEAAQLAELSTQLRQIRLRYETLKRQYLAKMRLLNERKLAGTKRLNKFKAAASPTFVEGANLELASAKNGNGTTLENGTSKDTEIKYQKEEEKLREKQRQKQEEQRKEEELARKVLSAEIDEIGEIERKITGRNGTARGGKEISKDQKIEGLIDGENGTMALEDLKGGNGQQSKDNISASTPALARAAELRGNSNKTNPSTKTNDIAAPISTQHKFSGKSSKAERKIPPKNKIKMPTLAELAEELSKLDERIIDGFNQTGTTDSDESLGIKNANSPSIEFENLPLNLRQNSEQNSTQILAKTQPKLSSKTTQKIRKPSKIQGLDNSQNLIEKIDEEILTEKKLGQSKNVKNGVQKNSALIGNLAASNNTSLLGGNEGARGNGTKNGSSNANEDELTAAQLEEDFLGLEGGNASAGIPSTPIRVIPTPRKRILTSDWLPPPNARLMDFSREIALENAKNVTAPKKHLDGGRKRGEGRMKANGGNGRKNEGEKAKKGEQKKLQNRKLANDQAPRLTTTPISALNYNHSLSNGTAKKSPKRGRVNQSASIGTRPPLIHREPQIPEERRPIPTVEFKNGGQSFGGLNGQIQGQQQSLPLVNSASNDPLWKKLQLDQERKNGGFYQLERTQVANVNPPKVPKSASADAGGEFKLKGVAQVQVEASKDRMEEEKLELNDVQLEAKLREEIDGEEGKNRSKNIGQEDFSNLEEFAQIDEQAICDAIACNFESGNLCEWEPSVDELNPGDPRFRRYKMARRLLLVKKQRRRYRRQTEPSTGKEAGKRAEEKQIKGQSEGKKTILEGSGGKVPKMQKKIVQRSWHNWVGQYRNRLTGIAKADVFSTRNQRFAASYLRPGQRSTLTGRLLTGEKATIRFWAWEATRDLQLRVCCQGATTSEKAPANKEEQCVFQTDRGIKRGSRKWMEHEATCSQGTKKTSPRKTVCIFEDSLTRGIEWYIKYHSSSNSRTHILKSSLNAEIWANSKGHAASTISNCSTRTALP